MATVAKALANPLHGANRTALPFGDVKKQLALLGLGLVLVLVLSAQLARAGTQGGVVPNDFGPVWSPDARSIAFTHEPPGQKLHWDEARIVLAGHGGEQHIGWGVVRAWQRLYDGVVTELEGQTWIFGFTSHPPFVDGVDASPSPDGQRIAYRRAGALYISNGTGGAERWVTTWAQRQPADITGPVWSPDGSEIAFADGPDLRVVRADGTASRVVASGAGATVNPTWSHDGTRLAFERNGGGTWGIWMVSAGGGGAVPIISSNAANNRFPQFSPVSDRLAFISDRLHIPGEASPSRYALYVVAAPGARATKLVDDVRPDTPARWSPTAAQLAVSAGQECLRFGIYVVASDGGRPHRRTNLCRFEGGPGNDVVRGTPYLDYLRGFAGNDTLYGGNGKNRIEGNNGNDRLISGSGADALFGGPGNDVLAAGGGNDLVEGGPGRDTLDAGPGDDTVEARDGYRDVIDCGPGRDRAEVDRLDIVRNCESVLRP